MTSKQTRSKPPSDWIEKYRKDPEKIPIGERTFGGGYVEDLELFDLRLFMEDYLGCVPNIGDDEELRMTFEDELSMFLDSGKNIGRAMILLENTPIKDWPYSCNDKR